MTTSLSDSPFQRVERRAGLVLGTTLSEHAGQSRLVARLRSHPDWVYKEYNADVRLRPRDAQLDRLIAFPDTLVPADRAILRVGTSWPASRVVGDRGTLGVIMPFAPDAFQAQVRVAKGTRSTLLEIDLLAQTDAALQLRGLPPQPLVNRVRVCLSLVETAELMERHGIVYLDWSYANAFWSHQQLTAYVIDIDSCSFGARPLIESPGWEDPLAPMGSVGDHAVDRYRVALLVGRCLTAERVTPNLPAALERLGEAEPRLRLVCRMIRRTLDATRLDDRAPVGVLALALRNAAGALGARVAAGPLPGPGPAPGVPGPNGRTGNVVEWRPIGGRRTGTVPVPEPTPAATVPTPRPAPDPVPVPADPPPWTSPVPVPASSSSLSAGAQAFLVLLGVVLAIVVLIAIVH